MFYRKYGKRLLDIIFGIIGLPFFILIFIFVALIIKIEDGGSVFYNAERIGENGKIFKMYKFRSMKMNSPDIRLEDGSTFNAADDQRVTTIGKFIRKTSIDEVPQILNVLLGDMSIIGPRPDPPDWLLKYTDEVSFFLTVKPGITGYSQAYFRNSVDGEVKMKNDLYYAKNISLKLDINIFLRTIRGVLRSENIFKEIE